MNAAAAPIPNSRIKIVSPTYDNARLLLLTSIILAALSGIQLAISNGKDATFLATVLDIVVAAGSIAGIIFALNHMRSMMIPVEAPGRFKNLESVMWSFRSMSIPNQDNIIVKKRGLWLFPLAIIPDECWVAMNRRVRAIVYQGALRCRWSVLATLCLIVLAIYGSSPEVISLLIVGSVYSAFYLWMMWFFRTTTEHRTTICSDRDSIDAIDHPQKLFRILEDTPRTIPALGRWRWNGQAPELRNAGVQNTGTFESWFLFEEQPQPAFEGVHNVFARAAFPLGCIGLVGSLWMLHAGFAESYNSLAYFIFAFAALVFSWHAASIAWKLESVLRFTSNVCLVDIAGDFSHSNLKAGRGRSDSLESENVAVRANVRLNYYAGLAVSEARNILAERELVGLHANDRAAEIIRAVKGEVDKFHQQGVALHRIRIDDPATTTILNVNLGLDRTRSASQTGRGDQVPLVVEQLPSASLPSADTKICPECAEVVRAAARKCRFCNYIFQ